MTGRRALLIAALAFCATSAQAHVRTAHEPTLAWTWDAWVVVPLLVTLAWFLAGWGRLHRRAPHPAAYRARAGCFLLGWALLAAALVTPLHAAGERSFAAHMLEHEVLMLAAAPLLVLPQPIGIALWALPHRARLALARAAQQGAFARAWGALSDLGMATLLQAAALVLWHLPGPFGRALASQGWHVAQHLCFVVTALLFWDAVLAPGARRRGAAVLCLFATATVSGALGALMALSSSPWYAAYAAMGMTPFGLTPIEDQQLAGLLMWVPGGLVHLAAALVLLARWLRAAPAGAVHAPD